MEVTGCLLVIVMLILIIFGLTVKEWHNRILPLGFNKKTHAAVFSDPCPAEGGGCVLSSMQFSLAAPELRLTFIQSKHLKSFPPRTVLEVAIFWRLIAQKL